MPKKPNAYFSSSLEKGLRVLSVFDKQRTEISLSALSRMLNISKTSTYRFANTLVDLGYLKKNPRSKLLTLGTRSFSMAHNILQSFELVQAIKDTIDDFFEAMNITIGAAVLDNDALFILYKREALSTVPFRMPIMSKDLYCTALGKAVLAYLPLQEALNLIDDARMVKRTGNTLVKQAALLADLEKTRGRGYSLNNEEYIPGLIAIGAPLINRQTNRVFGSVCLDFLTVEHSARSVEQAYAETVKQIAQEISDKIIAD